MSRNKYDDPRPGDELVGPRRCFAVGDRHGEFISGWVSVDGDQVATVVHVSIGNVVAWLEYRTDYLS